MIKMIAEWWELWSQSNALYGAWAASHDLTHPMMSVLYVLNDRVPATQKDVAERAGLPKQTVHGVIKSLETQGYVEIISGKTTDRRKKLVSLTDRGAEHADTVLAPLYAIEKKIMRIMGKKRVRHMIDDIAVFNALFREEVQKDEKETE